MKVSKKMDRQDEIKGQQRYVDQPGQWIDTTPKALKARQDKGLKALMQSIEKREAKAKAKAKK